MGRELIELWREHDSTGLRAEAKLIPHRSRGARRPENIREFQRRFRDDTANYKGKPPGFPFLMAMAFRRRSRTVMMVCRAMLAHVTVVRGRAAGLGTGAVAGGLWSVRPIRRLHCRGENRRCGSEHQNA